MAPQMIHPTINDDILFRYRKIKRKYNKDSFIWNLRIFVKNVSTEIWILRLSRTFYMNIAHVSLGEGTMNVVAPSKSSL